MMKKYFLMHSCSGYGMGHAWLNAVGTEWVTPGLPRMVCYRHSEGVLVEVG